MDYGHHVRISFNVFVPCFRTMQTGYPWEVVRYDITYPVRFFGQVSTGPDGKKVWSGGEAIKAVAYDLPIPGYK